MALPTVEDFQRSRVTNPNQSEIIRQRLYDFQLLPAAGATQLTFFSTPVGQGITSASGATPGSSKTFSDTNMNLGGQLPSGKAFLVESIEVYFMPGAVSTANTFVVSPLGNFETTAADAALAAFSDVGTFYQSGLLEFNILSKNYLQETPLSVFPPKTFFDTTGGVASNGAATGVNYIGSVKPNGRPYYIDPTISIQSAMNFEVLLKWPGVVPMPSGFNGRVGVILDGYMYRASQ